MKYNIGDIFEWLLSSKEVSTLTDIYYDLDGETRYILESYSKDGKEEYTKDYISEEELTNLIEEKITMHYPVKK